MTCYSYALILVRPRGPWPDQKSRVNDTTRTTKYHRKRAYFVTSTAVPHVAYGTVRTRMIRTTGTYYGSSYRMIPAAFHGHTLTGMRVPVLQNDDSSCNKGVQYFEYRKYSKYFGCLHCCCCGYCLCSGLCTANHILVYQYEHVQGRCLSKRTYRYSHGARMNVLSVEQYHTTYCRPG